MGIFLLPSEKPSTQRQRHLLLLAILWTISLISLTLGIYYTANFVTDTIAINHSASIPQSSQPSAFSSTTLFATPRYLNIPAINLSAAIVPVELAADDSLQIPNARYPLHIG